MRGRTEVDLGLAAAAGVLMTRIDRIDRRTSWAEPRSSVPGAVAAGVFAVLAGISVALVIREPLYGFYAWAG